MNFTVIDNFLEENIFRQIQKYIVGPQIDWYYNDCVIDDKIPEDKNNFQLVHLFYKNYSPTSQKSNLVLPIVKKINPKAIIRIKANLTLRGDKIIEHGLHTDIDGYIGTTAVYYINTNDGYTKFENGEKVESVENRIVFFKSNLLHTGTNCTDIKNRVVINFNFVK